MFSQAQQWTSNWIETSLNIYRDMRDQWSETLFHGVYGSPTVQALAGLKASEVEPTPASGCRHRAIARSSPTVLKS